MIKTPRIWLPFLVVGMIFLVLGGIWGWKTWNFVQGARSTEGKVVRMEAKSSKKSGSATGKKTTYAPVFRFKDDRGQDHEVVSSVSGSSSAFRSGEEVKVLYDPQNPDDARIHCFSHLWLLPTAFGAMGAVFAGLGVGSVMWKREG